jgi:cysteine desulfurase
MLGTLHARRRTGRHLVVSAVEHSSVLHAAGQHERDGGKVTTVGVDRMGRVDPEEFAAALRPDTALACLQTANHEVGTLQPVAEVAEACRAARVPLLVDAAQSAGRVAIPGGWSLLTASAHKWGGPPGVGVLIVRKNTRWRSPMPEDEREARRVPGFENVPGVVAAAAALEAYRAEMDLDAPRLSALVDLVRERVPRLVDDVEVIGDPVARLPHLVTFSCLYVEGEALLTELDRLGYEVSSGSSCTADTLRPSHVLEAMGVITHGNVRVSLSRGTRAADVDRFLAVLPGAVHRLRQTSGVTG